MEEDLIQDKCNSAMSLSDSDDSKSSKYMKSTSGKRSNRFRRQKKKSIFLNSYRNGYDLKRKGRYKKHLCLGDFDEPDTLDSNSEMADDIPTAHIEIISTHGIVGNSELSQISLTPDMSYSDLQLYPAEEETNIPEGSPISVEIHSTNSNSLLSSDLQSTADIADYS